MVELEHLNHKPVFSSSPELIEFARNGEEVLAICPAEITHTRFRWWHLAFVPILFALYIVTQAGIDVLLPRVLTSLFTPEGLLVLSVWLVAGLGIAAWRKNLDVCVLTDGGVVAMAGLEETRHGVSAAEVVRFRYEDVLLVRYMPRLWKPYLYFKLSDSKRLYVIQPRYARLSRRFGKDAMRIEKIFTALQNTNRFRFINTLKQVLLAFSAVIGLLWIVSAISS